MKLGRYYQSYTTAPRIMGAICSRRVLPDHDAVRDRRGHLRKALLPRSFPQDQLQKANAYRNSHYVGFSSKWRHCYLQSAYGSTWKSCRYELTHVPLGNIVGLVNGLGFSTSDSLFLSAGWITVGCIGNFCNATYLDKLGRIRSISKAFPSLSTLSESMN